MDVVGERPLAVDLHDRKPLPVAALELGVAVDLDLDELELALRPQLLENVERALTQVAAGGAVEDDLRRYG